MNTSRLKSVLVVVAALCFATSSAMAAEPAKPAVDDSKPWSPAPSDSRGASAEQRKTEIGKKNRPYYDAKVFDLNDLPVYTPTRTVGGKIRIWGLNYLTDSSVAKYWMEGFKKFHPGVTFDWNTPTGLVAFPGLIANLADIGTNRRISFDEMLMFNRTFGYDPTEVMFATGSYNVPGWAPALAFFVHKDNPLTKISMNQIDGIFGAERNGAYEGVTWHKDRKRGPEKNIRKWGQMGLTGEWAEQTINPYGRSTRMHQHMRIEELAFQGSTKWNEHTKESYREQVQDLSSDRYGIAWGNVTLQTPETKILAVSFKDEGPFVVPSLQTIRDRTYPFAGGSYMYLNRKPGTELDPKVKEFVLYVLSRNGQSDLARDGKWLPLTLKALEKGRAAIK